MEDKQFLKQLGLRMKCTRIMAELEVKQVSAKCGLVVDYGGWQKGLPYSKHQKTCRCVWGAIARDVLITSYSKK